MRRSVHKTIDSWRILSNKDEVKKSGRNTSSHWTSERKERELFPCCSERTSAKIVGGISRISVSREKKTVPCLLGWGGGMKVEAWAKAWGGVWGEAKGLFERRREQSICPEEAEEKTCDTER